MCLDTTRLLVSVETIGDQCTKPVLINNLMELHAHVDPTTQEASFEEVRMALDDVQEGHSVSIIDHKFLLSYLHSKEVTHTSVDALAVPMDSEQAAKINACIDSVYKENVGKCGYFHIFVNEVRDDD